MPSPPPEEGSLAFELDQETAAHYVALEDDAILERGWEFGISRMVCNVHWSSDVAAGRTMGAAAVARLHADEEFLIDLEAAKQEVGK